MLVCVWFVSVRVCVVCVPERVCEHVCQQTEQCIGHLKGHTAKLQCIKSCAQANVVS